MAEQSSLHAYLNWTKHRIDEMDATLASLEAKVGQVRAEARATAEQTIAELKTRRDEFQARAKAQAQAGEAAMQAGKAQLESQWQGFEAQVKTYFDFVGRQVEHQEDTFRTVAAAQAKAWREAADRLHGEATKIVASGPIRWTEIIDFVDCNVKINLLDRSIVFEPQLA